MNLIREYEAALRRRLKHNLIIIIWNIKGYFVIINLEGECSTDGIPLEENPIKFSIWSEFLIR